MTDTATTGFGVGAISYAVFVLLLWSMVGRPGGAERFILDKITALRRRIGWIA